ncbi:hypothetical protein FCM35_KLT17110 [Carex littledalei]|uniref:Uncharacterized protein n=1 Tax=Carex littledalei TaxID=544730 RepID=A0A833RMV3_9POAL|nr:hypothetical protein FCM35_KLT17110 [Carex littledalei]
MKLRRSKCEESKSFYGIEGSRGMGWILDRHKAGLHNYTTHNTQHSTQHEREGRREKGEGRREKGEREREKTTQERKRERERRKKLQLSNPTFLRPLNTSYIDT